VEADDLLVHRRQQLLQQDVHLRQEDDEENRAERLEDQVAERQPPHLRAALAVASMARMPLPMLAPITRPSATVTGMTAEVARVAISSTTARLE
jgi:hypothetical protein